MRTSFLALIAAAGLAMFPACKKDEATEETPADESAVAPEEAPETPPEPEEPEEATPDMANKMANCPSAVEGAKTSVEEGEGAVVVTVIAQDEAAVTEIRKRATHLASLAAKPAAGEIEHTGEGTGGGGLGKCPVVMTDVKVAAEDVEGGSKVTVTPTDAAKLPELVKTAKDRAMGMEAGGHVHGSGMGGGQGGADKAAGDEGGADEGAADETEGAE